MRPELPEAFAHAPIGFVFDLLHSKFKEAEERLQNKLDSPNRYAELLGKDEPEDQEMADLADQHDLEDKRQAVETWRALAGIAHEAGKQPKLVDELEQYFTAQLELLRGRATSARRKLKKQGPGWWDYSLMSTEGQMIFPKFILELLRHQKRYTEHYKKK